jgi:hypothetical protein
VELWSGVSVERQRDQAGLFLQALSKSDPDVALAAYASSSPEVQPAALKGLCAGLAATEPDQALQLVLQQSEPAVKAECAATLFANWWKSAPDAALAALEANASQFDLNFLAAKLPASGRFGDGRWSYHQNMDTGAIEARIHQLIGVGSVTPASP